MISNIVMLKKHFGTPPRKFCRQNSVQRLWRSWRFGLAVVAVQDFCQQKKLHRRQWWTWRWRVRKEHPRPALVILKEQQVFCHFVFHCKVLLLMVQVLCQRHNGAIHHWLCNVSTEHKPTLRKVSMVLQNLRCKMRMSSLTEKATYEKPESCSLFFYDGCLTWRLLYLTLFLSGFEKEKLLSSSPWFHDMNSSQLEWKSWKIEEIETVAM